MPFLILKQHTIYKIYPLVVYFHYTMKIRDTEFYYGIPAQHFFIEIHNATRKQS